MSRRDFIKVAAGGAAGLGAAAIIPSASAFKLTSDRGFLYYNQTSNNPNFEINTQGNLDLNGSNISNVGSLNATQVSSTSFEVDQATFGPKNATGLPVVSQLSRRYEGAVQADDGTHYALALDGSDLVLYKGDDPNDLSEIYRWSSTSAGNKRELHLTANGSLLIGVDGKIKRSTDNGQSWTDVYNLPSSTSSIWSFSENSSGDIVASQSSGGVGLFQSTDDGVSWTQIADGTTFSNFPDHVHRARYHPSNDYLIITGGDGAGTKGFYRSADNGSSWDFFSPIDSIQWVGIGCHPTNGSTYFLAGDDGPTEGPILKIDDDGTSSLAGWEVVHAMDIEQSSGAQGSFEIATVDDPNGRSFYLATSVNQPHNLIWASYDLTGRNWRVIGEVGPGVDAVYSATKTQGAHEQIIDPSTVPRIINSDRSVALNHAGDYHFGVNQALPADQRETQGDIKFGKNSTRNFRAEWKGLSGTARMVRAKTDTSTKKLELAYGNNRFYINNETDGTFPWWMDINNGFVNSNVYTRYRSGVGFGCVDAEDLSGKTGNFDGEIRRDDGTNTADSNPANCEWDNAAGVWRVLRTDGSFS